MLEADIRELIVDENGLDVLYWKQLRNIINGSIRQKPAVRVKNRKADWNSPAVPLGGSSPALGQRYDGRRSSGGAVPASADSGGAPAVQGGSSSFSQPKMLRSKGLSGKSSGNAFKAVAYSNGVVGDWNSPTGLGDRSSSGNDLLIPGQRFDARNSGVALQDSANSGARVGGALRTSANTSGRAGASVPPPPGYQGSSSISNLTGPALSSSGLGGRSSAAHGQSFPGQRFEGWINGVAPQASANPGGGVGVPLQASANPGSGFGFPLQASANPGGGFGVPLQASANPGGGFGGFGAPLQASARPGGGFGFPLQASANPGGEFGVPLQASAYTGGGFGVALNASANSGGGFGVVPPPPGGYQASSSTANLPASASMASSTAPALHSAAVPTAPAPKPAAPPAPAPPPPPPVAPAKKAPPPPPPPAPGKKAPSAPPPPPPKAGARGPLKPPAPPKRPSSGSKKSDGEDKESVSALGTDQVMLKPLHWEKLNVNPEHSMVWDKIERGSFQYSEDKMEALFGFTSRKSGMEDNANSKSSEAANANIKVFILDPRKSRNTAIVLKSLGTPRSELIDSLLDGRGLSIETLETLQRTVLTREEESEILAFDGDPAKLADAESFLYSLLKAVPLAYTRASTMLFRLNYKSEILNVKESLKPMEPACSELRGSGLFLKLLEAILKAGNRLNAGTARGGAKAFNLTTLLKLSDFKSSDGKTTLLSFVVHEVIRNEGRRMVLAGKKDTAGKNDTASAAPQPEDPAEKEEKEKEMLRLGLPVVSHLSSEFLNVKKAASMDYDGLKSSIASLKSRLDETRELVSKCRSSGGAGGFLKEMEGFLESAEVEMKALQEENTRVMDLVTKTTKYYQAGSSNRNPLQLFIIVKDFLGMVDQTCAEIARAVQVKKPAAGATSGSSSSTQQDVLRTRAAFPGLKEQILLVNKSKLSSSSDSDDDF